MSTTNPKPTEAEELNLKEVLASLGRRWQFILAGAAIGGFVAAVHTSRIPKTWEGDFQIVLTSEGGSANSGLGNIAGNNSMMAELASLAGGGGKSGDLQTVVKILESSSVLMPVFEKLQSRITAFAENTSRYTYNDWFNNLTVKPAKGTSVLTVGYRDTNKDVILPVLRDISTAFQAYSSRERIDNLANGVEFAERQAEIYRKRSEASFRAMNSFGLNYGISSSGGGFGGGASFDLAKLLTSSSNGGGSSPAISFQGGGSGSLQSKGDPLTQLSTLNQELIRLQQTFTDKDPSVAQLKKDRDALRSYIETSALGKIAYPGRKRLSKEEAQNVLLRYQELERISERDQSTLDSMESALLSLKLEQARASQPWQMISPPTLTARPVAPRPARNLAIGLASGLLLGCAAALSADYRSGKIFTKDQFSELLPAPLLLELPSDQPKTWNNSLRLLGLNTDKKASIAILPLGVIELSHMNIIKDALSQVTNATVEVCSTTLEARNYDKQLLLAAPGSIKRSQLDRLNQELSLQQTPIIGWIWLNLIPDNA